MSKVPAEHFVTLIAANVNSESLTDEDFRQFIRNSLPVVEQHVPEPPQQTWPRPG